MNFRKFSKYAFFVFLFLFPFQTVLLLREPFIGGEKWQYGTIGLYFTDILLFVAIFSLTIASRFWRRLADLRLTIFESKDSLPWSSILKSKIENHKSATMLALLVLWSGLSIFWAADQALAGYFFVKLFLGAGAFFIAQSLDDEDTRTAIRILIVAAVIQAAIGIGQFAMQSAFASSLLGMSHYEAWQAGTSVLKNESGRFLRAYGSFPHPNILGGFLAIILVIAITDFRFQIANCSVIASDRRRRGNPEENEGTADSGLPRARRLTLTMTAEWTGLLIILLALILAFSRAAWLGAAMGIVAYCVFCIRSHVSGKKYVESGSNIISRSWNYVTFLKTLGVLGIAAAVFVFVLRDQVFPRFDSATIGREGSVSERMVSLADAKTLIAGHPLLGVGAGNFTAAIMEHNPDRLVWSVQPAHNVFVLVLAELGAVGLVLFSLFVGGVIYSVILSVAKNPGIPRQARNDSMDRVCLKKQSIIFGIAFLALLPGLLLDHWLWSSHFGLLFFFLLAGLTMRRAEN